VLYNIGYRTFTAGADLAALAKASLMTDGVGQLTSEATCSCFLKYIFANKVINDRLVSYKFDLKSNN